LHAFVCVRTDGIACSHAVTFNTAKRLDDFDFLPRPTAGRKMVDR
jgi:hypothetical protein